MIEKIHIFQHFRALTNPAVFNSLCDYLEKVKVKNHHSNAIGVLIKETQEQFKADNYVSGDKILKLICEIASTTPLMRQMIIFSVYNAIKMHQDQTTMDDVFEEVYPEKVIDVNKLNNEAMFKWILEFSNIINPKKIPDLITELEKIGFERS